ncbi:hypothetical protein N0V86_005927 [Didymella sp. IMI 355093]|nr:hypothetical protein N0V86_005927 [Didymella sp. IMI 355093]
MTTEISADATSAAATTEDEQSPYVTLLRGDVIKVKVGPDHVEYCIHAELLLRHSEYFKRALNGSWKEAEERAITLEDVECEIFELFLEWLYTQQYPKEQRFSGFSNLIYGNEHRRSQINRLKACTFGDRFMAPRFRASSESSLIDAIVYGGCPPYYISIIYAYEHLPPSSPVLQALIDRHCRSFSEQSDTDSNGELKRRSQLPHNFLVGVMLRYMRLQSRSKKKPLDRCDYHGHTSDDEKGDNCKVPRVDHY